LADPNTRQGKRTPVTLKIKFKSETLEQFIERYAVDVSQGGIFIRTKEPLSVGTQMKFEFQLRDASPLIAGEGTVVWTRENDPSRPAIAPGMGVRFDRLAEGSQQVLEKILAEKAKQAPSRGNESPTKPPMFTDTPTRVAPAPVVAEALGEKPRTRRDSEQTPLPNPVPFHSDADDFDESAFAEATKVRSLDELAAQTAGFGKSDKAEPAPAEKAAEPSDDTKTATKSLPADELAERRQSARADSTIADPPAPVAEQDRESAPVLPSPPEPEAKKAEEEKKEAPSTKLGVEPAKAATARKDKDKEKEKEAPRAVATETAKPAAPSRPSSAPVVLGILAVLVLVAGGVYFFVLRDKGEKTEPVVENTGSAGSAEVLPNNGSGSADVVTNNGSGSAGSADVVTNNGSGSAGSAAAMTGSDGSAGSAAAPTTVKTVIASNVAKGATIEVLGTDQKGPAPLTAKLEKDKEYKARITAPGFIAQEIDVKGGQEKVTAKLVAKQKTLNVVTDPAGADVYVDGVMTGKITPSDVELTPAQAARPRNRITLKRPGYKPVDQFLDASSWNEGDSRMTGKLTVKLVVQPKVVAPPPTGSGETGSGAGSATPSNTGTGSGSSTSTTTTPPPPPPSGGGSAEAPAPTP
jgi:uncharacterized protein (TIGR02266 family)